MPQTPDGFPAAPVCWGLLEEEEDEEKVEEVEATQGDAARRGHRSTGTLMSPCPTQGPEGSSMSPQHRPHKLCRHT